MKKQQYARGNKSGRDNPITVTDDYCGWTNERLRRLTLCVYFTVAVAAVRSAASFICGVCTQPLSSAASRRLSLTHSLYLSFYLSMLGQSNDSTLLTCREPAAAPQPATCFSFSKLDKKKKIKKCQGLLLNFFCKTSGIILKFAKVNRSGLDLPFTGDLNNCRFLSSSKKKCFLLPLTC